MEDIGDLLSIDRLTPLNSSEDTILRIEKPFLDLDPQDWPIESKRIDIITQLEIGEM